MAARLFGCKFWPSLSRRYFQQASGLTMSARGVRPLSKADPRWCTGQLKPAALSGDPLSRLLHSTQLSDVYTAPPQLLAREVTSLESTTLLDVQVDLQKNLLHISWEGGNSEESQAYPFVWLRDNCHCPQCLHPTALGRQPTAQYLDVDTVADTAKISPDGKSVTIQWDDGHESEFLSHWLRYYRFDQSPDEQLLYPKRRLWGSDFSIKRFDFDEVLAEDHALCDWLGELVTRGIAIVENAPAEVGQVSRLGERIAFLRSTSYGTTWQVLSKPDPSSVGYTTGDFALHTDYTSLTRTPGVVMLHCIVAAGQGGENLLVDGFKVAQDLKEIGGEAYRLLTTYPFDYSEKGTECFGRFYMHSRHPAIKLNEYGELEQIAISNHSRDPMMRAPVDQIQPIYRAFDKFFKMLRLPEYQLKYKLQKGEILTNDNRRVLHGRTSYQVTEDNVRHLEGAYIEWDDVNSRLRNLALQLQRKPTEE